MRVRIILLSILVILIGAFAYASTFTLDKIVIDGCVMSSEDEIRDTL